jgi:hypothetical protein
MEKHVCCRACPADRDLVVAIAVIPLAAFSFYFYFYFFETPARRLISGNRNLAGSKALSRGQASDEVAICEAAAGLDR